MAEHSVKRKHKNKKQAQVEALRPSGGVQIRYDETLLAIVGISEAIKGQSNVSAWVRLGAVGARPTYANGGGLAD